MRLRIGGIPVATDGMYIAGKDCRKDCSAAIRCTGSTIAASAVRVKFTFRAPSCLIAESRSTEEPMIREFCAKVSPARATCAILSIAASITSPLLLPARSCATASRLCAIAAVSADKECHSLEAATHSAILVAEKSADSCSIDNAGSTIGGMKLKFSNLGRGRDGKLTPSAPTLPPSSARSIPRATKAFCPVSA